MWLVSCHRHFITSMPTRDQQKQEITVEATDETLLHWTINALNRHGYTCLQAKNAPAGLPHLQVIAPDALYLTWDGKHRTFTSFGKLLEEIK